MAGGTYSLSDLASDLRSDIYSIVKSEVYNICLEALRSNIRASVYAGGGGNYYDRTFDVLNAVDIVKKSEGGGYISFAVEVNPAKIGMVQREGTWNAHMGVNGESFNEGVIEVLDQGTQGHSLYNHPASHFYQSTFDELDGRLVGVLASALASRGWDVSIR